MSKFWSHLIFILRIRGHGKIFIFLSVFLLFLRLSSVYKEYVWCKEIECRQSDGARKFPTALDFAQPSLQDITMRRTAWNCFKDGSSMVKSVTGKTREQERLLTRDIIIMSLIYLLILIKYLLFF